MSPLRRPIGKCYMGNCSFLWEAYETTKYTMCKIFKPFVR